MLSISFELDVRRLAADLPDWVSRRVPSITRNALNDTVVEGRMAETKKIEGVFDRATPWIIRSPRYIRATKESLAAEVYIQDEPVGHNQAQVLRAEVTGGSRRHKRFEIALIRAGVMRSDEFAIAAIGQRRDAFGNLPGTLIVRILSQLRAFNEVGFVANKTAKSAARQRRRGSAAYFVPAGRRAELGNGRLPRGIYERKGRSIRAVVIFVRGQPHYTKRYDFGQATFARAERVFPQHWQRYFEAEMAKRAG